VESTGGLSEKAAKGLDGIGGSVMNDREQKWQEEDEEGILLPPPPRRASGGTDHREEAPRKAPWPLRFLAWTSLAVICFGVGYLVASGGLKWIDKKGLLAQRDVVQTPAEVKALMEQDVTSKDVAVRRTVYKAYVMGAEGLAQKEVPLVPGVLEEDLRQVLDVALEPLRGQNGAGDTLRVLHVFRAGDMLYLDVNDAFLTAVKALPSQQGALVMTGLVRTVTEGFPPLSQVRILVNGKEVADRQPVDLTVPWTLAPSS